jgi:glycerol-3-phosphate dehydrogenase
VESVGAMFDPHGDEGRGVWRVQLRDVRDGSTFTVVTKALINAAGPMVDAHNAMTGMTGAHRHVFSKGIHLIVPRITNSARVLTFFADDGRLFFVIPMGHRTCIGTTDTRVESPDAAVTDDDRRFVLDNINKRLRLTKPLSIADVISERCGVRPLVVKAAVTGKGDDWFALSRKHEIEVDDRRRHVSIFGGKLTDCINVGEEIAALMPAFHITTHPSDRWYGEPDESVKHRFMAAVRTHLVERGVAAGDEDIAERLWRRYHNDADALLAIMSADPRAYEPVLAGAPDLRGEVIFAAEHEMVTTLMDHLRRRTKLALTLGTPAIAASPALPELCALLFGDDGEHHRQRFLEQHADQRAAVY